MTLVTDQPNCYKLENQNLESQIKCKPWVTAPLATIFLTLQSLSEIHRTINGKKVEKAVTQIFHGEKVLNTSVLLNPHALKDFEELVPEVS